MLYNEICVIGLGTIGGFLARSLSYLETTKKLLLIDYDIVEIQNIRNSIYTKKDIGKLKTEVILEKIDCDTVISKNIKFMEGITKIPKLDLTIDCRDFTYDRKNLIDMRLYISFNNLIIDCRKNVTYLKQHEGKYLQKLSKTQLDLIATKLAISIENQSIIQLIKNQQICEIPLEEIWIDSNTPIKKKDIIYDTDICEKKLLNLHEKYPSIIDINQENKITVCIGSKSSAYPKKVIEKNNFHSINDIINVFSELMQKLPFPFNYYFITITKYNRQYYVELLPETGAA